MSKYIKKIGMPELTEDEIKKALQVTGSTRRAAERLGLSYETLLRRMKKLEFPIGRGRPLKDSHFVEIDEEVASALRLRGTDFLSVTFRARRDLLQAIDKLSELFGFKDVSTEVARISTIRKAVFETLSRLEKEQKS